MKTKLPTTISTSTTSTSTTTITIRKALIKDLELQIDFLVGYKPSGTNWKIEYHIRKRMIEETLNSEQTPSDVIDKINRIQDTLYTLHQQEHHKQGYLRYTHQDYQVATKKEEPILLYEWVGNERIARYI